MLELQQKQRTLRAAENANREARNEMVNHERARQQGWALVLPFKEQFRNFAIDFQGIHSKIHFENPSLLGLGTVIRNSHVLVDLGQD